MKYTNSQAKSKVRKEFIEYLKLKIRINERALKNQNWASSGSDYHNFCRLEAEVTIKYYKGLLKRISKLDYQNIINQ